MDILGKLFSSNALVKIMRLFLLNEEQGFEVADIVKRSKVKASSARMEINLLSSIGFVKKKTFFKEVEKKSRSKKPVSSRAGRSGKPPQIVKKKVQGWFLNPQFKYLKQLKILLAGDELVKREEIAQRLRPAGKITLLILGGMFVQDKNGRVDLLIVGNKLKEKVLSNVIKTLESEIGSELSYAVFDTNEFLYRLDMYDRLICDILERPHRRLIDTLLVGSPKQ